MFLKQIEKRRKSYLIENECIYVDIHNVRIFDIETLSNFWFYQSHCVFLWHSKPTYIFFSQIPRILGRLKNSFNETERQRDRETERQRDRDYSKKRKMSEETGIVKACLPGFATFLIIWSRQKVKIGLEVEKRKKEWKTQRGQD